MVPKLVARNSGPLPPNAARDPERQTKLRTEANDHLDRLLAPDTTIPWYRSIAANIGEKLHPPSLPPLETTFRPIAEKDMPGHDLWGLYRVNRNSGVMSVLLHAGLFGLLWSVTTSPPAMQPARRISVLVAPPAPIHAQEIHPAEVKPLPGGGRAGRTINTIPQSAAAAPPRIMRHYTPPPPSDRPPLAATPKLYIPPEWVGTTDPNAHYGNPLDGLIGAAGNFGNGLGFGEGSAAGSGPGSGGGSGGGIGNGTGRGAGSGSGPAGQPIYTAAKGMTPPEPIFRPDAEYTDEARKAQLNGKVVLTLVVETDGTATNIEVTKALGMGLEQKAIEAVRQWKFKPATIAGKPVRARVNVEVAFRLLVSAVSIPCNRGSG